MLNYTRLIALTLACLLCGSIQLSTSYAETSGPSLEEVEAAFVVNFLNFIDRDSFKDEAVDLCLDTSTSNILPEYLMQKKIGIPINIRGFEGNVLPNKCSVVVTSSHLSEKIIGTSKALVIVNGESACNKNTHIRFFIADNKVRFAINNEAAKRDSFQVSSKLLALAKVEECS